MFSISADWSPLSNNRQTMEVNDKVPNSELHYMAETIELTTTKSQTAPSVIIERNMTNSLSNHKTTNYNFHPSYHKNHKNSYVHSSYMNWGDDANGSYEVHENAPQHLTHNLSNVKSVTASKINYPKRQQSHEEGYESYPNEEVFGARTSAKRVKQPSTGL